MLCFNKLILSFNNHHKMSFALVVVMRAAICKALSQAFYIDYLISSSRQPFEVGIMILSLPFYREGNRLSSYIL